MTSKMKFIVIIGLVVIIPALMNGVPAPKVVPLPDLLNPDLIRVDEDQMYIIEDTNCKGSGACKRANIQTLPAFFLILLLFFSFSVV